MLLRSIYRNRACILNHSLAAANVINGGLVMHSHRDSPLVSDPIDEHEPMPKLD